MSPFSRPMARRRGWPWREEPVGWEKARALMDEGRYGIMRVRWMSIVIGVV